MPGATCTGKGGNPMGGGGGLIGGSASTSAMSLAKNSFIYSLGLVRENYE